MSSRKIRGAGRAYRNAVPGPVLHRSVHRWVITFLAVFALIDGATLLMCPSFGGDCLYGFFTLIAYPVILSGPLGMLLPQFAMRYGKDWRERVTGAPSRIDLPVGLRHPTRGCIWARPGGSHAPRRTAKKGELK